MTDAHGWGSQMGVTHRYCLRHVASNLNRHFNNPAMKNVMKSAGYQAQPTKLYGYLTQIQQVDEEVYKWMVDQDVEKWSLALDGGHRWGNMTTNIAECVNNIFKRARRLPVTALVAEIFAQCTKYFQERATSCIEECVPGQIILSKKLRAKLEKWEKKAQAHIVNITNAQELEFEVLTRGSQRRGRGGNVHRVNLLRRTCQCGKFQAFHYPCSHAMACCVRMGIQDYKVYVDSHYRLETTQLCYQQLFVSLGNPAYWVPPETSTVTKLIPNEGTLRRIGRPKHRIQNEMDQPALRIKCTLCGGRDHVRGKCTDIVRVAQYKAEKAARAAAKAANMAATAAVDQPSTSTRPRH